MMSAALNSPARNSRPPRPRSTALSIRVPTLQDGDVTIFESGAIVQYILARYGEGRLAPDVASAEFSTYLQWLHYAEGMIMPPVNTIVVETIAGRWRSRAIGSPGRGVL